MIKSAMSLRSAAHLAGRIATRQRNFITPTVAARHQSTTPTKTSSDAQIGDYPDLPWTNAQTKPVFGWWDEQERRNYNETIHEEDEILSIWSPDLHKYNPYKALFQLSLFFAGVGLFAYNIKESHPVSPVIPRTYPYDGLKNELGGSTVADKSLAARSENDEEAADEE
ncbi:uncharacterized protein VTP21DRAFT_124 [Calcarisporiella thermophila]|uniref:uncharacterized protein n=1 Tax=Calcarisporiella thermophila TaxID=911321 RepID=UPI003742E920